MKQPRFARLAALVFVMTLLILGSGTSPVYAVTQPTLDSIMQGTPFYDSTAQACEPGATVLTGKDNIQKAFNYFVSKGLDVAHTAVVVGNLDEESDGVNPTVIQNPPGGTTTDPSWIVAPQYRLTGWGIAQWTPGARAIDIAKALNISTPINDLATQLDMVWGEMNGTSPVGAQSMVDGLKQVTITVPSDLNNVTDTTFLRPAVEYFRTNFEGGDQSDTRENDALQVLQRYGPAASTGSSACAVACTNASSTPASTSTTQAQTPPPAASENAQPIVTTANLSIVRQQVVCIANQELAAWKEYIKSPPPYDQFIKYTDNNVNDAWCADFVSWVYKQAGYPFDAGGGYWRINNVPDLVTMAKQSTNFHWHPYDPGYTPRPGDIGILNNGGGRSAKDHTNLVVDVVGTKVLMVGGDQDSVNGKYGKIDNGAVVDQWSVDLSSGNIDGYISPDN